MSRSPDSIAEEESRRRADALTLAAKQGDVAGVQAILQEFPEPVTAESPIYGTRAAINEAIMNNKMDIVRLLTAKGVEVDGYLLSQLPSKKNDEDAIAILGGLISALGEKWNTNEIMKQDGVLEHYAFRKTLMAWLLSNDMDPNLYGERQREKRMVSYEPFTPMDAAVAMAGRNRTALTDVMELIYSHGGKVTKASLFYAMDLRYGSIYPPVVYWLLDHGADPNVETAFGLILTFAIVKQGTEMVNILLERGADMNKKSARSGLSPLYVARRHRKKILPLLEAHASFGSGGEPSHS